MWHQNTNTAKNLLIFLIGFKCLSTDIKRAISSVTETSAKALEIQQFRKELNDYLDKKEQDLIHDKKQMK